MTYKQHYTSSARSIRYVRHSPQKKMVNQASFAIIFRQHLTDYLWLSTSFNELQSSAVGNSRFSTMDCCTVRACAYISKACNTFFYAISNEKGNCLASQYTLRIMIGTLFFERSIKLNLPWLPLGRGGPKPWK